MTDLATSFSTFRDALPQDKDEAYADLEAALHAHIGGVVQATGYRIQQLYGASISRETKQVVVAYPVLGRLACVQANLHAFDRNKLELTVDPQETIVASGRLYGYWVPLEHATTIIPCSE